MGHASRHLSLMYFAECRQHLINHIRSRTDVNVLFGVVPTALLYSINHVMVFREIEIMVSSQSNLFTYDNRETLYQPYNAEIL